MPPISAVDTIGPAIQRTKAFLFQPFRLSTYLKLCLVAALTEGYGLNLNFNSPMFGFHSFGTSFFTNQSSGRTREDIAIMIALVLAILAITLALFYLTTRLRFAYFHCLVHNLREIRPGWRLYRSQANRFFSLNIIVGITLLLLAVIVVLPLAIELWRMNRLLPAGGQAPTGMVILLLLIIAVAIALSLMAVLVDLVLRDFLLPHYALENATAHQAWAAAWTRIRSEKLTFFVYALLRLILPTVVFLGILLILLIPALIFLAAFVIAWLGLQSAFASATGGVAIIGIILEVIVGIVGFAIALLVGISVGGPLSTAIREYALLFYGARYDRLGGLLFPPSDPPLPSPETA